MAAKLLARPRLGPAPGLRRGGEDVPVVAAALGQGLAALAIVAGVRGGIIPPLLAAPIFAIGLWWCSNTISHIHMHTPLFRSRRHNRLFALYLTALTGVPQSLWRARHLWHHAGEPADRPPRIPAWPLAAELALVAVVAVLIAIVAPPAFVWAWVPGYLLGLGLCQLHGHYEHAGAPVASDAGVSCYNALYNRLWLNDGYHAEHHRWPGRHWSELPEQRLAPARSSAWPPVLRWLEPVGMRLNRAACAGLGCLERLALWSPAIARLMLERHDRALATLWPQLGTPAPARVAIVGGGLFPRTAILLGRRWPASEIVVIESDPSHIERARAYLAAQGPSIEGNATRAIRFVQATFDPAQPPPDPESSAAFDVLVVPLGYRGDREALYKYPPAPIVLVHDWLWRRRGETSVVVSWGLLKRLNVLHNGLPCGCSD